MSDALLKLALVGFSGSDRAALELFLHMEEKLTRQVEPDAAEAIVYNADQPGGLEQQLERYRRQYDKPGIVVSIRELEWERMILLRKPYSRAMLRAALARLRESVRGGSGALRQENDRSAQGSAAVSRFREQIRGGRIERNWQQTQARAHADRKKAFQAEFLARKRQADRHLERLKAETRPQGYARYLEPDTDTPSQAPLLQQLRAAEQALLSEPESPRWHDLPPATPHAILDCCGQLPDLDLDVPSQYRRLQFNPEGQLLALALAAIERSRREQTAIAITGVANLELVYEPEGGRFYSGVEDQFLVQLAHVRFKFGELALEPVTGERTQWIRQQRTCVDYSANQLLWKLACWSSRGRLICEVELDTPYRLRCRPEPGLLLGLPHTGELVEAWQEQALTVRQVLARTGVQQRYLFPFASAAWVLRWLCR